MEKLKVHYDNVDFQPSDLLIKKYVLPNTYGNEDAEEILARIIEFSIEENQWVAVSASDFDGSVRKAFVENHFSQGFPISSTVLNTDSMLEGYNFLFSNNLLDVIELREDIYLKPTGKAISLLKKFAVKED